MKLSLIATVALCLAVAATAAAALERLPAPVTLTGVGGARPGISVAQVEQRLGLNLQLDTLPGSACAVAAVRGGGMVGYAIFIKRRLGSLWFRRGAETDRGIGIGSTIAELRAAYPKLRSRPDRYQPEARNYFVRRQQAPHWRLRFDVSPRGQVTWIAFGNDTVFLVEGCL